jgi:short-subunit dehydrogenase
MSGQLVLVTGASSGIGRAAVSAFVEAGARVVGIARCAERLAAVGAALPDGSLFHPLVADVADAGSMAAMAARVSGAHGVPDVVVANAGIGLDALFVETTDDALRAVLETNLLGVYRTVRPFLPAMVARGSGRVLLVSSIVGKRGIPHYSGYSASKFALHGVADALRPELRGTGVTVGVVCPASTDTGFRDRALRHGPAQRQVRPRRHTAESVGRAIVRMAGSRRREAILGFEAKLLVWGDALAPGLVDWILARSLTRRERS